MVNAGSIPASLQWQYCQILNNLIMKKMFLIICVALLSTSLFAQDKQKVDSTKVSTKTETTASTKRSTSVQCSATAKSTGNRCKHMTYSQNGKCSQHGGN
jgi:hypothetical protein